MASEIGANNYTQVHRQCIYKVMPLFWIALTQTICLGGIVLNNKIIC